MCGIAGIVSFDGQAPVRNDELERMSRTLIHRGPDGAGTYIDPQTQRCGLAHRRLSIIDLAGGKQPLSNEDQSLWISYNGECYNFQTLRRDLESAGHRFRTHCDTEVVVHLYERYGSKCVDHMRGMFALAIWDQKRQELFLARDRLGQKPLFYGLHAGRVFFASECKAIVALDGFPRRPDVPAIIRYLLLQYVPAPASGFADIRQLPPAHHLTVRADRTRLPEPERYWSVPAEPSFKGSFDEAIEQVRATLTEATRMRMISDVPLGAFLSGGIDSTTVVGVMSELDAHPVKACTIGFDDSRYDELPYARQAAERFGCELTVQTIRPNDCLESIDHLSHYYDEPFADSSALPTYYVSRLARSKVTVALTGDAGDELFAGYHRYIHFRLGERMIRGNPLRSLIPRGILRRVAGLPVRSRCRSVARHLVSAHRPVPGRYLDLVAYFTPDQLTALIATEPQAQYRAELPGWDYLSPYFESTAGFANRADRHVGQATIADANTYLPGALNTKVDRASMSVSLELRCPFQDHKLVELAYSLPTSWRLNGSVGKYILRKACADLLPSALLSRPKKGFSLPLNQWFRRELRELFVDTVLSNRAMGRGYFQRETIDTLLRENDRDADSHGLRLWALLMLELWHRRYIDSKPEPGSEPSLSHRTQRLATRDSDPQTLK